MEFWDQIRSGKVQYVHFAPPCGTASAARNIRRRFIDPKPLRPAEFPEGLPELQGTDKTRVEMSNELYKFVARAIVKLEDMGISFSVENPTNSLMWSTKWFKEVMATIGNCKNSFHANWVHFQMCMHGGKRPKKTSFLYGGAIVLSTLEAECNHSPGEHMPWGLIQENGLAFATALERNYPQLLCKRVAKRAAIAAHAKALPKHGANTDKIEHMEAQPRRSHNALMSEYKEIRTLADVSPNCVVIAIREWQKTGKPDVTWQDTQIGKGFGLLSVIKDGRSGLSRVEIGLPWSTEEFTDLAMTCLHPFDKDVKVPPAVARAVASIAKLGPINFERKKRQDTLKHWAKRKVELAQQEEILKKKLDPEVRRVIQPKAILLFAEMLQRIHYDDMAVVELLTTGTKVL